MINECLTKGATVFHQYQSFYEEKGIRTLRPKQQDAAAVSQHGRILAWYQVCYGIYQFKISSLNLWLAGRPINKLVLLCLVGQLQIYGGNFKLIGHVITHLARILSSSSNISVKDPMTMKFFSELAKKNFQFQPYSWLLL